MKQELFELDELVCLVNDRIKKLDWLMFQLVEEVTGDDAIVVGLALDTVALTSQKMDKIQAAITKLREQDAQTAKDLECLQEVA